MPFELSETLDILERTPGVVDALLRGTSGAWHAAREGPDTWSAYDVVGHLIHGEETDWVPRMHDLNHVAQIARVMAKRYTEDVGVWRADLSILDR